MKEAVFYQKLDGTKVRCVSCAHYCVIVDQKTGLCGVRKNQNGKLYLLVYGKPAAVHVDPVEKKPLFHFLPGTEVFSFGTVGCNFSCGFCQNWDISQITKPRFKSRLNVNLLTDEEWSPQKIVDYCTANKIPSIAYTYNEPSVFLEYAYDTAVLARKLGIKNIFVSNGYFSEKSLDLIAPYADAMNIDLKSFQDEFYKTICHARLGPVLETIKRLKEKEVWLEITTLIIPGKNDSAEELAKIANFIASLGCDTPWHISRFYPSFEMSEIPATAEEVLIRAYEIGKKSGLSHVYLGNVMTGRYENTYCPHDRTLLIKREGYKAEIREDFRRGVCKKCHQTISGVWGPVPFQ
jgi:pyruvate formate lyase activating enzyme